jgi:hypothetical protein
MRELMRVGAAILLSVGLLVALVQTAQKPSPRTRAAPDPRPASDARQALHQAGGAEQRRLAVRLVRVLTLDVTDPWQPVPLALDVLDWLEGYEANGVVVGPYAFLVRGYGEITVRVASGHDDTRLLDHDTSVAVVGPYALVTAGGDGLSIVGFSGVAGEPSQRYYAAPGAAELVLVDRHHAYVLVSQPVPTYSGYDQARVKADYR